MKACEPERIETFRWLAHHVMISNAWSLEMPPPAKYKKGQHLQSLLEQPWGERPAGIHLQVQSEPLLSWEQTRWKAFRKACSWLATARSRASVEVAERHFRSFHANSLRSILLSTAQWPVFDLLHRLARRPRLDDDLSLEDEDARQGAESEESTWPAGSVEAGQQRLSPALVLEYYRLFHVVTSLFSLFRLHWWVSHGTLIGALRDGGLSRHADDCEVDLPEKEVEILQSPAMLARLSRNGYELSYDPRGRCFKVWPGGSARADAREAQLVDQSWWLPQQRVGTPSLDIYLVQTPEDGRAERMYISNDVFHCNELSCQQYWNRWELQSFYEVPFGLTVARVPSGAASYLERVYGWDWNITVRPHGWASQHGEGFEAKEVASLHKRAAEPFGPLPHVL
ncbi:unnamed protein product [Durusdinium trenchii]|uniref:Uncharacterized protein n=1 Tax=Durusdinium trenchii TaxID=1381693 RepID=A0ABP0I1Z7_9DINO